MSTITRLDRATVRRLSEEVGQALRPLAERHGISITMGRGSFTADNATLKVEIATVGDDGTARTPEMEAFTLLATSYGLEPGDLGATFIYASTTYTVAGLKPRATRTPILAREQRTGKLYRFPVDLVRALLGGTRAVTP